MRFSSPVQRLFFILIFMLFHNSNDLISFLLSFLQLYPPKSTSYRSECELFGSYVSLDCPSPPAPPSGAVDTRRDPQVSANSHNCITIFLCSFDLNLYHTIFLTGFMFNEIYLNSDVNRLDCVDI